MIIASLSGPLPAEYEPNIDRTVTRFERIILGKVEFGHAGPNLPMPVGIRVGLDARQRALALLEPAVGPYTP